MIRFLALAALCSEICFGSSSHSTLNGLPVYPGEFEEVLYIRGDKGRCTATAIGRYVVLTAAHCVDHHGGIASVDYPEAAQEARMAYIDGIPTAVSLASDGDRNFVSTAKCSQHPYYRNGHLDYDYAICKTSSRLPGPLASISHVGPELHEDVLLVGYGCTKQDDGSLTFGRSTVNILTGQENWFYTGGRGALCFAHSGGPCFKDTEEGLHRYIYGVNSRGDVDEVALFSAVYSKGVRNWMRFWGIRHTASICGISAKCDKSPNRKQGAHVRFEAMLESM